MTPARTWVLLIAATVASLLPGMGSASPDGAPPPIGTRAQAQAGAALYAEKCTGCHSADLGEGGHGPALKGDYFWTTWRGQSARKLYGTVISTMPASDPGSLSPDQTLTLVAFILQSNGYPAGDAALMQPADLQDMVIVRPHD